MNLDSSKRTTLPGPTAYASPQISMTMDDGIGPLSPGFSTPARMLQVSKVTETTRIPVEIKDKEQNLAAKKGSVVNSQYDDPIVTPYGVM